LKIISTPRSVAASIANSRTFSSLQNPVYRWYFFGMLGQFASMNMQSVAGGLLIYRLTDSSALLGAMSLAFAFPMIFVSMFGGAVADRVQKKQVLMVSLVASAIISLLIAIALTTGLMSKEQPGSWWLLIFSGVLQGTVMGMMLPARQALIPEIVTRDQAMNAVALNTLGMNVLSLVAPGVAGFLIDAFDFKAVYFAMFGLNLYATYAVGLIKHTSRTSNQTGNLLENIGKGFSYVRRDNVIFLVLAFTLVAVVFAMPYQQLLPIYVDTIFGTGATGLGVLMMVSGAGALVGSLTVASLPNRRRGLILLGSGLLSAIAVILFAFSQVWAFTVVMMVFLGLSQSLRGAVGSALLQSYTSPEYMGRVMSLMMMQWGVMNLCTFGAGLLATVVPVQWVLGGFAATLLVLVCASFVALPRLRRLD
jgi:MFS transporter, DHA1 family, staphyloferrin A biosynthesis exporter